MTPAVLFDTAAQAVYGPDYKPQLALRLKLNLRTVRRMADGTIPIPAGVWSDLGDVVLEEVKRLERIAAECKGEET